MQEETSMVYQRLRDDAPLGLQTASCLTVRSQYSDCRRCADECPAGSIAVADGALTLQGPCLGCGRCAAVCPTGALGMAGFAVPRELPPGDASLAVDCWKVPAAEGTAGTLRVPCLGGLSTGQLLALQAAAGKRRVELLDRGWCSGCAAGAGDAHPARAACVSARELLDASGMASELLPAIVLRPLPLRLRPTNIPDPAAERRLSRRSFFGGLAAQVTAAVADFDEPAAESPSDGDDGFRLRFRSIERERMLDALGAVTATTGRPVPAQLFPAIEVAAHCASHLVCAALCPTGALAGYESADSTGLMFEAGACIACGLCERACPEAALRLLPAGNGAVPEGPKILTRRDMRECQSCGGMFAAGAEGDTTCPACRRSHDFARSAFSQLFGARGESAGCGRVSGADGPHPV
jgi:ferredoxin